MSSSVMPKSSSVSLRPSKLPNTTTLSLGVDFEEDAAVATHAARFEELRAAGLVEIAAVDREIDIGEVFGGSGDRERIAHLSVLNAQMREVSWAREAFRPRTYQSLLARAARRRRGSSF